MDSEVPELHLSLLSRRLVLDGAQGLFIRSEFLLFFKPLLLIITGVASLFKDLDFAVYEDSLWILHEAQPLSNLVLLHRIPQGHGAGVVSDG